MKNEIDKGAQRDTQLARMFSQMRQQDTQQAPAFPASDDLLARAPVSTANPLLATPWKMAVAASIVAITAVLMYNPAAQDPAALYADIMNANPMATDSLLSVSYGTLPEMGSLPGVFELGAALPGVSGGR